MTDPSHAWPSCKFGDIAEFRNGLNFTQSSRGQTVKVVGVADFGLAEELRDFAHTGTVRINGDLSDEDLLQEGDLLFVRSNGNKALVGRCVFVHPNGERLTFSGFTIRARITSSKVDPWFMSKVVRSPLFKEALYRLGGGSSINNLSQGVLSEFEFPLPPLTEQRKISEILRTWDEAIDSLEALRMAKEERLNALRSSLLFGSLRFSGPRRNWKPCPLANVTRELTARNGTEPLERTAVMGVTNTQGIVPMRAATVADDISRYKRLPPRAFAYNPMRINVGSIAMNDREEEVLVSPDYVVFACKDAELDPRYLNQLRKTQWWTHYINSGGSGSVRQRTYYDDLAALELPLPAYEEQQQIVQVLDAADDDVKLTEREIAAVSRQKRGLMQKLLTGEWRVKLGGN